MKHILLIATGGTIASRPTSEGLAPGISSGELASCVPEISALCRLEAMQLFNLDSTNMNPKHWLQLASAIEAHYGDYDGFVVTHGTDTMAYAAATLSYLIQNSPKPIVLTGAQRTIYDRDSDARQNLADAVRYAADDRAGGVTLVFDGQVITGTRARKMRTKSFNAFSSIDFPPLAVLRSGALHLYIPHRPAGPVRFFHRLDPSVFVLKLIPGMQADIFDYLANNCHAVIIESFGVGGIPYYDSDEFADKIALLVRRGVKELELPSMVITLGEKGCVFCDARKGAPEDGWEPAIATDVIDPSGAGEIASRSRGTPRIANRMLRRVRDFAQLYYDGVITREAADHALGRLEVDALGLDAIDRRMLTAIITNYGGGPVGLETLAATIGEEAVTLEDVYEPYLMQIGFLTRTPRGRCVTQLAYDHLHLENKNIGAADPAQPEQLRF